MEEYNLYLFKCHAEPRIAQILFVLSCKKLRPVVLRTGPRKNKHLTFNFLLNASYITYFTLFEPISSKSYFSSSITFFTSFFLSNSLRVPTDLRSPYELHIRNPRALTTPLKLFCCSFTLVSDSRIKA